MSNYCSVKKAFEFRDIQVQVDCVRPQGHIGEHEGRLGAPNDEVRVSWANNSEPEVIKLNGYVERRDGRLTFRGFVDRVVNG